MKKSLILGLSAGLVLPRHVSRQTGTYQISDLRANYMSVYDFGLANALAVVVQQMQTYNGVLNSSLLALTETTTERSEASPAAISRGMAKVDEFGVVRTQKSGKSYGRGFPLDRYQDGTGWTEDFWARASVADMMVMTDSVQLGHTNNVRSALADALYNPIQRVLSEYVDPAIGYQILDNLFVKPLYNADGEIPSVGPAGQSFDGTHNHYLFSDGLTGDALDALTNTVGEHTTGNSLVIYCNVVDASKFRALAGFVPAVVAQVTPATTTASTTVPLDVSRTDDKFIGYTASGIPVYIKPWALQNYALCINLTGPRAIKRRVSSIPLLRGLRIKGENGEVSLYSRYWEDNFGFGVSNRAGAAVLYFAAGAVAYVAPATVSQYGLN
jgi:hypothetical protein